MDLFGKDWEILMNSSQQLRTKRINHNEWKCLLIGQAICYPEWSAKPTIFYTTPASQSIRNDRAQPEFNDLNIRVIQNIDSLAFY